MSKKLDYGVQVDEESKEIVIGNGVKQKVSVQAQQVIWVSMGKQRCNYKLVYLDNIDWED